MWDELPTEDKEEYKRMILAFASLTEMFAQKEDDGTVPAPIINSKYQETVFQKVFGAFAEDIGNTSYDASLIHPVTNTKYLIGIKTFGISSGDQKVAQFKANQYEWKSLTNEISSNSVNPDGTLRTSDEINEINRRLYFELARNIAILRNRRIDSSISNIRGFKVSDDEGFESVYHVLMPSKKGSPPIIYVGETSYDHIDIDNIKVIGCTDSKHPENFNFTDGNHRYRYTSADNQLLMSFNNRDIVLDQWDVKYADDAYAIFSDIANRIYTESIPKITESYCWKIVNRKGEVEQSSGFNAFWASPKLAKKKRNPRVDRLMEKYRNVIDNKVLESILEDVRKFLIDESLDKQKQLKMDLRRDILIRLGSIGNDGFKNDVIGVLFSRPVSELYIPIPNSKRFHEDHPDFFVKGLGNYNLDCIRDVPKPSRQFTLVFEPSGERMESLITQQRGKAIESVDSQSILGEWILRKVFQLGEYEPLTRKRLDEIGINGIRLYKLEGSPDVHFQFIWIDDGHLPEDYFR